MIIERLTGRWPKLFRPPYGARWFALADIQSQLGLATALWTIIGNDWMWPADRVAAHVLRRVDNGSIVCLHDGRRVEFNPDVTSTLRAIDRIIPALQDSGFQFETVTQIAGDAMKSLRGNEKCTVLNDPSTL